MTVHVVSKLFDCFNRQTWLYIEEINSLPMVCHCKLQHVCKLYGAHIVKAQNPLKNQC